VVDWRVKLTFNTPSAWPVMYLRHISWMWKTSILRFPTWFVFRYFSHSSLRIVQDTINWLLSQEDPPTVFTTSYANEEATFTQSSATLVVSNMCSFFSALTLLFFRSLCNGYMQLAAIGTLRSTFLSSHSNEPPFRYLNDFCVRRRQVPNVLLLRPSLDNLSTLQ
jgi:hypothetical protein